MAELLMWSDKGGSFFWACCALNGFPNSSDASINGLAKQKPSLPGVSGIGLMDLMDCWITLTLTNQPLCQLSLLDCWDPVKQWRHFGGQGGRLGRKL